MQVPPPTPQVDVALLAAVSAGHTQAVELLLAAGANVDGEALRSASESGHVDVVRVLLYLGLGRRLSFAGCAEGC